MKINIAPYVTITPRIISCKSNCTITVKPRFNFVSLQGNFKVSIIPRYQYQYDSIREG